MYQNYRQPNYYYTSDRNTTSSYPIQYQNSNYNQNGDRFIAGGFLAPLLLGGIAGYAIGNNRPNNWGAPYYYPQPCCPPRYWW